MFHESLEELNEELTKATHSVPQIVGYIEKHDEKACATLVEFLKTIGVFATIFAEDIGWKFGDTLEKTAELNEKLERAMTRLVNAQENNYWVSICDLLEYEILPVLENWQKIAEATIATLPQTSKEI